MADPLSILASAVTLAQAVDNLRKIITVAQRYKQAPSEVEHLAAEAANAASTLSTLQTSVIGLANERELPSLDTLRELLAGYGHILADMEALLDEKLFAPSSTGDAGAPRKWMRINWMLKRSSVENLRQRLRDNRLAILAELGAISS